MNKRYNHGYDGAMAYMESQRMHGQPRIGVPAIFDKSVPFRTFMHYSDQDADKELTVFGRAKNGLFYNYSDRICGEKWDEGCELANKSGERQGSAKWFEVVLNHFHSANDVDLQHVILGCNRATGYHYLVFGYTYTEPKSAT